MIYRLPVAARAYGRRRHTHDIDIFVRFEDADRALESFANAGFEIDRTNPAWIYKAFAKQDGKDAVVDVIFKSSGGIYLDDEMIRRGRVLNYEGRKLPVLPPEDFIVIKALAHDSETPRHWLDALSVIRNEKLDWRYLIQRALAVDARAGVLDITVMVSGNRARLHGQVPSERRKQAAAQAIKELAPELEAFNHLKVVKLKEPSEPELVE